MSRIRELLKEIDGNGCGSKIYWDAKTALQSLLLDAAPEIADLMDALKDFIQTDDTYNNTRYQAVEQCYEALEKKLGGGDES